MVNSGDVMIGQPLEIFPEIPVPYILAIFLLAVSLIVTIVIRLLAGRGQKSVEKKVPTGEAGEASEKWLIEMEGIRQSLAEIHRSIGELKSELERREKELYLNQSERTKLQQVSLLSERAEEDAVMLLDDVGSLKERIREMPGLNPQTLEVLQNILSSLEKHIEDSLQPNNISLIGITELARKQTSAIQRWVSIGKTQRQK